MMHAFVDQCAVGMHARAHACMPFNFDMLLDLSEDTLTLQEVRRFR